MSDYTLYRLYNSSDQLLYIGRSTQALRDIERLRRCLVGWPLDIARFELGRTGKYQQIYEAHQRAITREQPLHTDDGMRRVVPVWVYRLYDSEGRLLYVGQSSNPRGRIAEHRFRTWAWGGDIAREETQEYPNRAVASAAEAAAIRAENPLYNVRQGGGARQESASLGRYETCREISARRDAGELTLSEALHEMVAAGMSEYKAARMLTNVIVRGRNPSIAGILRWNEGS